MKCGRLMFTYKVNYGDEGQNILRDKYKNNEPCIISLNGKELECSIIRVFNWSNGSQSFILESI